MRQVTQQLRNGRISVIDVPRPVVLAEEVLVDVRASLLSAGTERSKVAAARSGLVGKAMARPDQARQVLDRARRDGVKSTLEAVRTRLDQPSSLGYSSAGVVLEVGSRVADLRPGDRVACAGGGYAVHAELNHVPGNLCVTIPDQVTFEAAAFTTVGSIAMHGLRQAEPSLGGRVAVIGLGLVGQLCCRLLAAAGCHVVGIDVSGEVVQRALDGGTVATAHVRSEIALSDPPTGARGCDAVIVTAATASDDPIRLAGALARDRARVVVIGDVGMDLPRPSYYGKELEVRLSRSYGPGRYDREYEERGLDYPIGYVRWTERRNMAAFVALLADGRVSVEDLITTRLPAERAEDAYERVLAGSISPLGIVLTYNPGESGQRRAPAPKAAAVVSTTPSVGVIGAGSFSRRLMIPGLRSAGFALAAVASGNGLSAVEAQRQFKFEHVGTPEEVLDDRALDVVAIASRHSTHADYAIRALERGKAVFVEKPPALTQIELDRLEDASRGKILQVGFNRRFAPLALAMRQHISQPGGPVELLYRVAAGQLPDDHWLNDVEEGGGRFLGEGCHFVDFCCWFMGGLPEHVQASVAPSPQPVPLAARFSITMTFSGGSLATIVYGSEAASSTGKELAEAHSNGRSARLDDYRRLELSGSGRKQVLRHRRPDKGHAAQFLAFRQALAGDRTEGPSPLDTMATTLLALRRAGEIGEPVGAGGVSGV